MLNRLGEHDRQIEAEPLEQIPRHDCQNDRVRQDVLKERTQVRLAAAVHFEREDRKQVILGGDERGGHDRQAVLSLAEHRRRDGQRKDRIVAANRRLRDRAAALGVLHEKRHDDPHRRKQHERPDEREQNDLPIVARLPALLDEIVEDQARQADIVHDAVDDAPHVLGGDLGHAQQQPHGHHQQQGHHGLIGCNQVFHANIIQKTAYFGKTFAEWILLALQRNRLLIRVSEDEFCQGGFKQFSVTSNNTDNA